MCILTDDEFSGELWIGLWTRLVGGVFCGVWLGDWEGLVR